MTQPGRRRVYLHLGSPKTGTTYLQEILWQNQESLAAAGVLYPGDMPEAHFHASMDLQRVQFQEDWFDDNVPAAWARLVDEAREWTGTVLLSHELFCTASPADVERAISDLSSFAEVHLICTARDLARQIPAVWQEDVKNRHVVHFADFVAGVRGDPDPHWLSELFWERQDLPAILRKWAADVPAERVHVITVPQPDQPSELLWERLCELLDVDPGAFESTVERPNRSLGVAETELLHRLNPVLEERGRVDWPGHDSVVKYQIAAEILGARKARTPLRLPDEYRAWANEQASRMTDQLSEAGYHVIGDLKELLPADAGSRSAQHPDQADEREVSEVALEALAGLVERFAELEKEHDTALGRPEPPAGIRQSFRHLCEQDAALFQAYSLLAKSKHTLTRIAKGPQEDAQDPKAR